MTKAIELADIDGIDSLSMRALAAALKVQAMSLYNHVPNKGTMLDGMVERVMTQIYLPAPNKGWTSELRRRYLSAHVALVAHPWVSTLVESRRGGPVQMRASNAVLGCLFEAGFDAPLVHRALLMLDSYLYGFAFQEATWPHARNDLPDVVHEMSEKMSTKELPHLAAIMRFVTQSFGEPNVTRGPVEYRVEFEFGLDLILKGLQQMLESKS